MKYSSLSHESRAAWLKLRKSYLTASEVAKLGPKAVKAMANLGEEKWGDTPPFRGNEYTEWGNIREPVIIGKLLGAWIPVEHNTNLLVSTIHPLFAATPDGLIPDKNATVQIKTAGTKRFFDDVAHMPKNYMRQCQWEMLITDAEKCLFVVEERLESFDGFHPGRITTMTVPRDDKLIDTLVKTGMRFVGLVLDGTINHPQSEAFRRFKAEAEFFYK